MKDINATIIVNLKPSKEEIMKNLHKDARWGIGRAEKDGLIVKESENKRDWKEFYKIYKKTMDEGGTFPASLDKLKEDTSAFFVCKKNKIIAGAGIWFKDIYDKNIPRLYFNASLKDYLNSQPNNLLYWHCILWAKKNGYEKFDLGGYQIKARGHLIGVNKFKEKWGEIAYFYKNYPFHIAIGRKLIRNFKFLWWLNKKLRRR